MEEGKIHEARCDMAPKQRGLASKSAKSLKKDIRKFHLSKRSPVQCPDFGDAENRLEDLEFVPQFNYLGNMTNSVLCSLKQTSNIDLQLHVQDSEA